MKKIRIGIIGLGYIGQVHLRHSLRIANAKIEAVADASKKSLRIAANAGVRKLFLNYKELLKDHNIDAVIISLPTYLHLESTKEAAEAKKHVFLEKPIARTAEEAKDIVSAVQKNGVKLMVGYPLRFNPPFCELKEKIESGILGDTELSHATYISSGPFFHRAEGFIPSPVPEWWFNKELTGGGALMDTGCHLINLLRWYFGEIIEIKSHLGHRFNMDLEDSALCLAKFKSGTKAVISAGWFSQDFHLEVDLFGSVRNAIVRFIPPSRLLTAFQMLTTGISKFYRAHYAELQYFVNCIINGVPPSPSGEDALKDLEVIEQAYKNQIRLDQP
jgi:predicted dehydrogenase